MADPRIIDIRLDERTIEWRSADIEQERRIAIFDLLEGNRFALVRAQGDDDAGPYRLTLSIEDGRLGMAVARADASPIEKHLIALGRFRRPIHDYRAICGSYFQAIRQATPDHIETVDMARRGLHDHGADLLRERLGAKIDLDFTTARRLFTLICVLHIRP